VAESIPTVSEPEPFRSLVIHCEHLTSQGRKEDDVSVSRSTVKLYEGLAAADPRYEPTLARAQFRLGHGLIILHRTEAEGPLREAVALFRRSPSTDLVDQDLLARSLTMLGIALAADGRAVEGLDRVLEGIQFYRMLAQADEARYGPALAGAMDVLSSRYAQLGRAQEAAAARDEAAAIRQRGKKTPPDDRKTNS